MTSTPPGEAPGSPAPPVAAPEPIPLYIGPRLSRVGNEWLAKTASKPYATLHLLRAYLNGTIVQFNRIADDFREQLARSAAFRGAPDGTPVPIEYVLAIDRFELDVHFYLICWDKLAKFFALYKRQWNRPEVNAICDSVRKTLEDASLARQYFEHLDKWVDQSGYRTKGTGIGPGVFWFYYQRPDGRGGVTQHSVELGRAEIDRVVAASTALGTLVDGWVTDTTFQVPAALNTPPWGTP